MRNEYLKKYPTCAACLQSDPEILQIHHLIPFHLDEKLEYDETNLITLCRECHFLFGHLRKWQSFNKHCIVDARRMAERIRNRPC